MFSIKITTNYKIVTGDIKITKKVLISNFMFWRGVYCRYHNWDII